MATVSQYMPLVGANRIVSLVNLFPTAIPPTLEDIYVNSGGVPQKGNKKVVIMVKIPVVDPGGGPVPDPNDLTLTLKVQVPAGIIAAPGLQKFDASTPELSYYPQAKLIPQNGQCYNKFAFATPLLASGDPVAQTVDVSIILDPNAPPVAPPKKDPYCLFLVEVDWSHSVPN